MSKALSRYILPVRVYLEDTDAQGIVYNASYFRFLERSRTEWLRLQGIVHKELRDKMGIVLVVARMEIKFNSPAKLDNLLDVAVDNVQASGARFFFEQSIYQDSSVGEAICKGVCEVTCMDIETQKSRRPPGVLVDKLIF